MLTAWRGGWAGQGPHHDLVVSANVTGPGSDCVLRRRPGSSGTRYRARSGDRSTGNPLPQRLLAGPRVRTGTRHCACWIRPRFHAWLPPQQQNVGRSLGRRHGGDPLPQRARVEWGGRMTMYTYRAATSSASWLVCETIPPSLSLMGKVFSDPQTAGRNEFSPARLLAIPRFLSDLHAAAFLLSPKRWHRLASRPALDHNTNGPRPPIAAAFFVVLAAASLSATALPVYPDSGASATELHLVATLAAAASRQPHQPNSRNPTTTTPNINTI